MKETIELIEKVTEFAINPDVKSDNKIRDLKQLLVSIYAKFLTIDELEDNSDYKENFDLTFVWVHNKSTVTLLMQWSGS